MRKQNSTYRTVFLSEAGGEPVNNDYFAYVELVCVLGDDGFLEHHPRIHEHTAHPGTRRRSCALPALRNDHAPQTKRELHDQGRIFRFRHTDSAYGHGQSE